MILQRVKCLWYVDDIAKSKMLVGLDDIAKSKMLVGCGWINKLTNLDSTC